MVFRHLLRGRAQADAPGALRQARLYDLMSLVVFNRHRRRVYGRIVELSGAQPGDRVLDVGCGPGYLTALAAGAVASEGDAVGIDPSEPMIDRARQVRGHGNCSFELGKAEALTAPDASFDVVLSSLALHHGPEAARAKAISEMYRVLRPGGCAVVVDFRPPQGRLGQHLAGVLAGNDMRHNPIDRLAPMAQDAGFTSVTSGDLGFSLHYVRAYRPVSP
ncbi:methylase involved in ubiquinone/menaquinone biosynthesis [Saccharomonospora xinjiangensis XJ-54]|uniref:Methylase involved in ubiquinone/menaquinone biosynthesis n=2 Tax=Saccharomonospora TaxID=1851 RepID=I0UY50_9PSEU|nr:methylase involved in ubiquinone/menaquinone biosynthesis [Saccharomonospora xinjiangensis XJ-54]